MDLGVIAENARPVSCGTVVAIRGVGEPLMPSSQDAPDPSPRRIDALDNLVQDHRRIGRVVEGFERYLDALERGEEPGDRLLLFSVFFREYADLIHHQKEERILFSVLKGHGFSTSDGPLAFVREQHDQERILLSQLVRDATRRGEPAEALQRIIRTGRELCAFQREHMARENDALYPAVRSELTHEERDSVERKLARFDRERDANGHVTWLLQLADELAAVANSAVR
jgi:hemerythrin-like domain-containing protein